MLAARQSEIVPCDFRVMRAADVPFVVKSWISPMGQAEPYKRGNRYHFIAAQHCLIEKLLMHPQSSVVVGYWPADEDQILGYAVGNPSRRWLHWVFVKREFRHGKICRRLLEQLFGSSEEPVIATATTPAMRRIAPALGILIRHHDLTQAIKP